MKTIVHIAMHTTNIGDGALVKGIQYTHPQDLQMDVKFVDHCITDFLKYGKLKFDDQYVEWLNNNANLLLIGGGGLISEKNYLPTILPPEIISKLKLPIVVYAVGHNLFDGEKLKNSDALSALIGRIRELGGLFSVRNDGSLDRLKRDIGVSAADSVCEVPDPGVFVPVETMLHPQIRPGRRNVVLQFAGDKLANRLGQHDVEQPEGRWFSRPKKSKERHEKSSRQRDIFWAKIAGVCNRLARQHDVNFFIAPHVHSDLAVTESFVSATRHTPDFEGSRLEVSGVFRGATSAPAYFDLYRQADFVVGMRGHSIIVAVGIGTPCVAIVSHPKVEGFLKDCGLEEWSAHIADENIEDSLSEKIGRLIADSSEWKRLRSIAMERMVQNRKTFHGAISKLMQFAVCTSNVFLHVLPYSAVLA